MGTPGKTQAVIVDDHEDFRAGIRLLLESKDDIEVVAEGGSAEDVARLVRDTRPDLLLLDVNLGDRNGIETIPDVLRASPRTQVVVVTACDHAGERDRAFRLGARGVVIKGEAGHALRDAIEAVRRGDTWGEPGTVPGRDDSPVCEELTELEREIVRLVAAGYKKKEVAAILGTTHLAVHAHLNSIFQKLGVRDRMELVCYALYRGLTQAA